ncbi:hypothetical protein IQ07DRAFT_650613 [Pyrenochaeta sp. DS3sAY3a]|nr:hypothetical protein IQ07DRAFT_650613 [Pyrenochaeta sp. DS3sAY3a]
MASEYAALPFCCSHPPVFFLTVSAFPPFMQDETVDPKREVEIRVVWSCYAVDVITASGVDKNSTWRGDFPEIPLPCSEAEFLTQISSRPTLLSYALEHPAIIQSLDLPALSAIVIHLRSAVLRCIRDARLTQNIRDPSSPFMSILHSLEVFFANLPPKCHFTELNMYMHKDQHTLGALISLHYFYHAAMCDLTRISLPGFNFPLAASFRSTPDSFTAQCQQRCLFHAKEISKIIFASQVHGRLAFDDTFAADVTFESTKIHIVCAALNLGGIEPTPGPRVVISRNIDALKMSASGMSNQSPHIRALSSLCVGFGFHEIAKQCGDTGSSEGESEAEVTGPADEHYLIKTALFRRAQSEARAQRSQSSPRTLRSMEGEQDQGRPQPPTISPTTIASTEQGPGQPLQLPNPQYSAAGSLLALSEHLGGSLDEPREISTEDYLRAADEMAHVLTWDASDWWSYNTQGH